MTEKICCNQDCNQGRTCPVRLGAYKPADAVHQIDEPQAEALRLADDCEESATHWVHEIDTRAKAAKMLRAQHARIAELEAELEAIGAGGVEPLRKGFVRLTDVLARLEQGFGANSAPVTTIKRHFEMQAAPAHPAEGVPAQAGPVGYVALAALTSRTHADDYAKCFATEAALLENYPAAKAIAVFDHAATQPAAQGMEQDAARYQALVESGNFAPSPFDNGMWGLRASSAPSTKVELDAAVDRVIAAQAKQGGASHG